ncbi:MAG: ASCH domain-containing protein [Candidatus Odinarchaeota archaeon]|nr:ASCH domain-containing protein [Candidatus Odinarchaeota archaeon]
MPEYLMSIKPKYAKLILKGEKKYELRKKVPYMPPKTRIVMYVSGRTKAIVGEFRVGRVLYLPKNELWKLIKDDGGITKEEFLTYFQGYKYGYAIEIKDPKEYKNKILLKDIRELIGGFQPPINFMRITKSLKLLLKTYLEENG